MKKYIMVYLFLLWTLDGIDKIDDTMDQSMIKM